MQLPQMIIFDYGGTLVNEKYSVYYKGTKAIMEYAVVNRSGLSPEEIQKYAKIISNELATKELRLRNVEIPFRCFFQLLYESLGITFSLSQQEIELVFWKNAEPAQPMRGIHQVLSAAREHGIRTSILCNCSFSQTAISAQVDELFPDNQFEWIISSSEVMLQKPARRVFQLALAKANLSANDVWYCGDSIRDDVEGASQAGIFPVWYNPRNLNYHGCDYLNITDYCQLAEAITFSKRII